MKIVYLFLLSVLALPQTNPPPTQEYYRGREGSEDTRLKLYEQGRYSYQAWMHLGIYTKDTGTYIFEGNFLILNSLASNRGNTRAKKKKNEKAFKYFQQDSLLVEGDKIIILRRGEHLNQLDSAQIKQRMLKRK